MATSKEKIPDFLKKQGMDPREIKVGEEIEKFIQEMNTGLKSQSSLAMIPTYVNPDCKIIKNKPIIAIDAGGENLRAALVTFDSQGGALIKNYIRSSMPGLKKEISKEDFFDYLYNFIKPLLKKSEWVGFCFSYPVEIQSNMDGRLLFWTKEIKAPEVLGELIGKNLLDTLKKHSVNHVKKVCIINDSVATLMAGKTFGKERKCDDYLGVIFGTGTNTAYIERNDNILKKTGLDKKKSQIVCLESGSYAKFPRGLIDLELNNKTEDPSIHIYEKMVSGGYLGPLCLEVLKKAAQENILSPKATTYIEKIKTLNTKNVNDFLINPHGEQIINEKKLTREDKEIIHILFESMVNRAVKLLAINISAVALKAGKGKSPVNPICININGSVFEKMKGFKAQLEYMLKNILTNQNGVYFELINVHEAPLVGAAIAALAK